MNLLLLEPRDMIEPARAKLSGRKFVHAQKVWRAREGQVLKAGLIGGLLGQAKVTAIENEQMFLEVELSQPPPKALPLRLFLSLPRPKALLRILQTVTTLGIKEIHLLNAYRVEKDFWHCEQIKSERIQNALLLGLEQARDTVMPKIHLHRRLKPFVEDELPALVAEDEAWLAHPDGNAVSNLEIKRASQTSLAIGPEGGFIEYEVELFREAGFKGLNFGPRILKVETAVTAITTYLVPPL